MARCLYGVLVAFLVLTPVTVGFCAPSDHVLIVPLPFTDPSPGGKYAPLAEVTGDMLVSFLSKSETLVFAERKELNRVLKEQELGLAGITDDKTRAKVGHLLGAKYVLTGSLTVFEGKVRIDAHLLEVETSRVARSVEAEGSVDDLMKPVGDVAGKLGDNLKIKLPPVKESDLDKSPVANLHFARGLGYYYNKMPDQAMVEFMKALAIDPKHARARYWNGVSYLENKEYEHAQIEFNRFLADFPSHELSSIVKKDLKECAAKLP